MAGGALCQPHDLVGHAAVQHQFAAEDEEGNGEEREHVHPRHHLLEEDAQRQALVEDRADRREPDGECHRHAENQEAEESDGENRQFHDGITFVNAMREPPSLSWNSAMTCSMENEMISTPEITSGT